MGRDPPRVLRLPPHMAESFNLAKLIAAGDLRWSEGYELLEQFLLRSHEEAFAKELLRRKTNLWLFRSNQRCYCGDFVVVDMSATSPAHRQAYVIELKTGQLLEIGASQGQQLAQHRHAIEEIARVFEILLPTCEPEILCGGEKEVLAYLCRW